MKKFNYFENDAFDLLKNHPETKMSLTREQYDKNTMELCRITSENHKRYLEKIEMENKKKLHEIKKERKLKELGIKVGSFVLGATIASIPTLYVLRNGDKEIIEKYNSIINDYGITYHPSKEDYVEPSEKYVINHGTTYVSFDEAVTSIIDEGRDAGMDDVEIAIGLRNSFYENKNWIDEYIDTTATKRVYTAMNKGLEKQIVKKK